MTPQQAYRLLRKLSDEGLLVRSGTRRTTVYALPGVRGSSLMKRLYGLM